MNDAPSGVMIGYINEDATTVADGGSAVAGTASGSNSGDVLANDTDPDASPTNFNGHILIQGVPMQMAVRIVLQVIVLV